MPDNTPLNVLAIGASRNIGYYSSKRLLAAGATVTFLLRSPAVFDADEEIQQYVKSGHAVLIKGDALVPADVQKVWDAANKDHRVDFVLFSVGGTPKFTFGRGFIIDPPNLVTQSLINVLSALPKNLEVGEQPRIIVLSSIGLTRTSHDSLPLAFKPLYGWLLQAPHEDKAGAERVVAHCTGWSWNSEQDGDPKVDIMGENWQDNLPSAGSLKRVLVIRPALLTDGDCHAERQKKEGKKQKEPYRVSEGELGGYIVSRKDVAHFVADVVLNKWAQYENKIVNIGY